jgi:ABC-type phosphate transport system substrate-binding protein
MAIRRFFQLVMIGFFKVNRRNALQLITFASLFLQVSKSFGDDVVIVINKDNPNTIDMAYVAKIYSGALRAWPDGAPVVALDQAEDTEVRVQFSAKVLNRSVANMKAIWSQNVFSGKGLPPRVVGVDGDVKRIISTNKNAIGYVLASQVDPSVKVLAR